MECKRNAIFLLLLIKTILFTSVTLCSGYILQIEGEMDSNVTVYITKRFASSRGIQNLSCRIYLPYSIEMGISTQIISNMRKSFTPYPTEVREFADEYGNKGVELKWNKEIRLGQVDFQFNTRVYSHFSTITSNTPFPITVNPEYKKYLKSTELSPAYDPLINQLGRKLCENKTSQLEVVNAVFLWLDSNIKLSNSPEHDTRYDALTVLKLGEGNEKGIANLAVSLFKGMGIPARVVYGISFQKEFKINTDIDNYFFNMPNSERYWIEVLFPDVGWVVYDPRGVHFSRTSRLISISYGPDTDYVQDSWNFGHTEYELQYEFIYDIKGDEVNINFAGLMSIPENRIVLRPQIEAPLPSNELFYRVTHTEYFPLKEELADNMTGMVLYNSDISTHIDLDATRNLIYAQRFLLSFPLKLEEIKLALIKFGDEGRIWIDVFNDNEGKPGKRLFRSYSIDSIRLRFMMIENPWLSFPFGGTSVTTLLPGYYWFALRSSGSCIFNWFASEGNVVGESTDTRFMDVSQKQPQWNNILNADLNFQITGTRVKVTE